MEIRKLCNYVQLRNCATWNCANRNAQSGTVQIWGALICTNRYNVVRLARSAQLEVSIPELRTPELRIKTWLVIGSCNLCTEEILPAKYRQQIIVSKISPVNNIASKLSSAKYRQSIISLAIYLQAKYPSRCPHPID